MYVDEHISFGFDESPMVGKAAYKLQGRLDFQGMKISVENRKGSKRHWRDEHSGESGSTTMKHPYGYIRMTEGTDGDHVDVYVGPHRESQKVYVVNQMKKPDFKKFDEQKVMLGFDTAKDARAAYLTHYNNPGFLGEMFVQDIDTFKEKVYATKNGGSKMVGKAGGPYYGPRGGKWADPKHTISWKESEPKKKAPKPKYDDLSFLLDDTHYKRHPLRGHVELSVFGDPREFHGYTEDDYNEDPDQVEIGHVMIVPTSLEEMTAASRASAEKLLNGKNLTVWRVGNSQLDVEKAKGKGIGKLMYETIFKAVAPGVFVADAASDMTGTHGTTDAATRVWDSLSLHHPSTGASSSDYAIRIDKGEKRKSLGLFEQGRDKWKSEKMVGKAKGGPYYGPRGGKWADPKHTISWKEKKERKSAPPKLPDSYSKEEREALRMWIGPDFSMIRAYSTGKPEDEAAVIVGMIARWESQPNRPVKFLQRGVTFSNTLIEQIVKAKTFSDDAVSSWTTEEHTARNFAYTDYPNEDEGPTSAVILSVKSNRGLPINNDALVEDDEDEFTGEAGEVIMAPQMQFKVVARRPGPRKGLIYIDLVEA